MCIKKCYFKFVLGLHMCWVDPNYEKIIATYFKGKVLISYTLFTEHIQHVCDKDLIVIYFTLS
jgi:hypothetical protein